MTKFIYKILLFSAIIFAIDILYGFTADYLFHHTQTGEEVMRYNLCKKDKYDIVILGSSRAVRHYDDRLLSDSLNLRVINAGLEGNGIVMMYGLFHLITNKYKPQLIIYDIEPCFDIWKYEKDDNNIRYLTGLKYLYSESGIDEIFKSVSYKENVKMNSSLYKYNSKSFSLLSSFFSRANPVRYGFEPHNNIYDPSKDKRNIKVERDLDMLKLQYLERMMVEARAKGVKLVIVCSPKYSSDSTDLDAIRNLCIKNQIQMMDFYSDEKFMAHPEYFNDPDHLNLVGANLFTRDILYEINNILN